MISSVESPPGYWPARIALLVSRGALPKRARPTRDAYRLGDGPTLDADTVARVLASMPKPIGCTAQLEDGVVKIFCGPCGFRQENQGAAERHLLESLLRTRYSSDIAPLRVWWVGRDERLIVSMADVADFCRDYDCGAFAGNGAVDWVDSPFAKGNGITASNAEGAVAVTKVFPRDSGWAFAIRIPRWLAGFFFRRAMRRLRDLGSGAA
jgi:hypothetical protein